MVLLLVMAMTMMMTMLKMHDDNDDDGDYNADEDCLVIPFSIRDNDTYFCKLKLNNIEWMDICGDDFDTKCSF